jgi:hypothetical protein
MKEASRLALKTIYESAKQGALNSHANTTDRQAVLMKPFVNMFFAEHGRSQNTTESYRRAMRDEAAGWRKLKDKVYFCSWFVSALFLGFGLLSRWAPRWRNGLSLFNCGGALLTCGMGYKASQACDVMQKKSADKAEIALFDIYSLAKRNHLKRIVTSSGLTDAIDQFVGQSCVLSPRDGRSGWIIRTLVAEDLLNLNYNLFNIEDSNHLSQVPRLWQLRAMAVGYAAAKEAYESEPRGRRDQFTNLCEEINDAVAERIPG